MSLTPHFTLEELCASPEAVRKGIDNVPDADVSANLLLLARGLEVVRSVLGYPMHVNSGYRSPKLNAAIGGSRTSNHMKGLAADFTCREYGSPYEIAKILVVHCGEIGFQTLIMEGTWVHIDFPEEGQPAYNVLTAHFLASGTTYTKGLA